MLINVLPRGSLVLIRCGLSVQARGPGPARSRTDGSVTRVKPTTFDHHDAHDARQITVGSDLPGSDLPEDMASTAGSASTVAAGDVPPLVEFQRRSNNQFPPNNFLNHDDF
jgi:hypothetical protein